MLEVCREERHFQRKTAEFGASSEWGCRMARAGLTVGLLQLGR